MSTILELEISEVSAQDLNLNWDVSNDGNNLKVNDLGFSGILDTLKNLKIDLKNLKQIDRYWFRYLSR